MSRDGLSLPVIATNIRRWALRYSDIDLITISSTGRRYIIGVLLQELSETRVITVYEELQGFERLFQDKVLSTYVFGPDQRNSVIFRSFECYEVLRRDSGARAYKSH